ncbi:hypothetical protein ACSBR1_035414 [Camellia fascicularis]
MKNWPQHGGAIAVPISLIVIFVIGRSDGRDLRPSEHGLAYQNNVTAAGEKSPEMRSFFGGAMPTVPAPSVPMPVAKNMSDASWWREVSGGGGGGGGGRRDHVRDALVVATMVCGATGVVLLVVAGLLFVVRYQRRRSNDGRPK